MLVTKEMLQQSVFNKMMLKQGVVLKGVLTREEVLKKLQCVSSIQIYKKSTVVDGGSHFFYTDDYCMKQDHSMDEWIPYSIVFPYVRHNGTRIDTLEKLEETFHSGAHYISSMNELLEVLNK